MVYAWDAGNPDIQISTTVTMTMVRNEYPSVFFPVHYVETVSKHDAVGTNITRVTATDLYLPVSRFKRNFCHNSFIGFVFCFLFSFLNKSVKHNLSIFDSIY